MVEFLYSRCARWLGCVSRRVFEATRVYGIPNWAYLHDCLALCASFCDSFRGFHRQNTAQKALIAFCILAIVFATLANYFYPHFGFTLLAQMSVALCGVCLAPAFAALTLGIVELSGYSRQVSLNEAYKHAGTAFSALLSLGFAFYYGIGAIFVITALMGVFSLLFLSFIRSDSINHKVARGQEGDKSMSL
ncbi:hypothetical protein [Helicobacter rodentium]|uniref:hypothetical protein n=1 Tax=Helicobacter rodentium TaxID=59617 RepID=UPI00260BAEC4|nr:hypothetical protein [Helicobacter rodentium]